MTDQSSEQQQYPRPEPTGCPGFPRWLAARTLLATFHLLYGRLARIYDPVSWIVSGGRWRGWQRLALAYLPSGRVLEIGPGPGHLLLDLLESGREAYAVEKSPEMLRLAGRRLARRGYRGQLVAGDARSLPFADGGFDGVVSTFPAPFLDSRFWREVARVLRPGGRVVVVLGAEARRWPWPGALEWVLSRLGGPATCPDGEEVTLAPSLRGRMIDLSVDGGVARLIVAERRSSSDSSADG